ncbi:DUF7793 family protein [Sorangium sp. So ce887]|uniref:DUF7793 family protein n=1 Tax=Sorangium sp. So ce887 TaxID=3133324 RepID=UPI003F620248
MTSSPLPSTRIADAREDVEALTKLVQGRPCPILIDLRSIQSVDRDARTYFGRPEGREARGKARAAGACHGAPIR